ncbi:hypothetical protein LTR27_005951 [Elasticomyces elasticus]|nr:hypothetical protein LTR27_005951 [Elasticomyces elasticus]
MISPISASAALAALKAKENLTPESRRTQLLSVDDGLSVGDLANIQGANAQARREAQKLATAIQLGQDSEGDTMTATEDDPGEEDDPSEEVVSDKRENMLKKVRRATGRGLERVSKDVRAAVRRRSKSRSADLQPELKMTSGNADDLEERVRRSYGKHIHLPGIGRRITSGKHPDPFHDQHAVSEGGKSGRRRSSAQPSTPDPFDDRHAVSEDGPPDESDGDVDNEERPLLHTPKSPTAESPAPGKSILKVKQHTPEESQPPANIEEPPSPTFRSKGKQRAVDPPHSPANSAQDPKLRLISPGQLTEEHIKIFQLQDQPPEELAKSKQDADEQLIECVEQYGGDVLQVPEHVHAALPACSRAMLTLERTHRRQQEENEELRDCIQQHGGDIMQVPDEAVAMFSERIRTLFNDERFARRLQLEDHEHARKEERQVSVEDNEAYARQLQAEEDERARQEEEDLSMAEMQRQAAEPGEGMSALERVPTRRERASSSTQAAPAESPEERRRTSDLQLAADERIIENTPELRERRNWLDKGGDPQWPESDDTLVSTDETTDEDDDELSPTSESVSPQAQAPPESQASQPSVGRDQGAAAEPVRSHIQAQPTREVPNSGPNFPHAASPANISLAEQLERANLRDRPASSGESHQQAAFSRPGPGPSSSSTVEKPKRKAGYNFNFKSFDGNRHAQHASSTAASTSAAVLPPSTAPSVPDERPSAPAATDAPAPERQSSAAQHRSSTAASSTGPVLPPVAIEAAASTATATRGNDQTEAPPIPPRHPRRAQPNPEDQNGEASRSRRGSDGVDSELGEGDTTTMQRRHPDLATTGGQRDGQRSQVREDGWVRGEKGILGVQALEYEYGMLLLGIEDLMGLVTNTWMRRATNVELPKARWEEEGIRWILFSVEQLERLVRSAVALRKENDGKGAMTSRDIDEGFRIEFIDHLKDLVMMIEMDAEIMEIKTAVALKQSGRGIIHKIHGDKTNRGGNTDTSRADVRAAAVSEARTAAAPLPPPTPKLAPSQLFRSFGGENIASTNAAPPTPRLSPAQLLASFGGGDYASDPHTTTSQVPPPTPRLKDNLEYFDSLPPPRSRHRGELFDTSPLQSTPAASSCAIIDDEDDDVFNLTEEERALLENAKDPVEEEAAWSSIKTRVQTKAKKVKAKRMADKKAKERRWGTAQDVIRSEDPTMIKAEAMRARRLSDERLAGLEKQNIARREKLVAAEKATPKKKAVKKEEGNFDVMADREDIANWAFTRGTGWRLNPEVWPYGLSDLEQWR